MRDLCRPVSPFRSAEPQAHDTRHKKAWTGSTLFWEPCPCSVEIRVATTHITGSAQQEAPVLQWAKTGRRHSNLAPSNAAPPWSYATTPDGLPADPKTNAMVCTSSVLMLCFQVVLAFSGYSVGRADPCLYCAERPLKRPVAHNAPVAVTFHSEPSRLPLILNFWTDMLAGFSSPTASRLGPTRIGSVARLASSNNS